MRAARPLLAALGKIAVASSELDELQGLLLLREDRAQDAIVELNAAIARSPGAPGLYICRADARMRLKNVAGAAADAAEAVILSPHSAKAKALLGIILIEMGQPGDAIACLAEAIAAEPQRVAYHQGLAKAQERIGDPVAAAATLQVAIRLLPKHTALRTAAIMLAVRRHDFGTAASIAETARRDGVADACVFALLGHALSSLGQHGKALMCTPSPEAGAGRSVCPAPRARRRRASGG